MSGDLLRAEEIYGSPVASLKGKKAHSCERVTDPVTFFQKMSYRGYILFRIHFKAARHTLVPELLCSNVFFHIEPIVKPKLLPSTSVS